MKTKTFLTCGLVASVLSTHAFAAPPQPTSPATTPRVTSSTPASSTPAKTTVNISITGVPVAAEVGPDKIMMADLNRLIESIADQYPGLREDKPEAAAAVKQLRKDRLDNMIAQQLLYQEARRQNLVPNEFQINREVVHSYDALHLADQAAITDWLKTEGKSEADWRAVIAKKMAIDLLKKNLVADIKVSDADVAQYYTAHKKDFTIPETVFARHIQISYPKNKDSNGKDIEATPEDKKKTLQKAQALLKKATAAGADFAALAKENSDDVLSKTRGGAVDVPVLDDNYQIVSFRPLTRDDEPNSEPAFFKAAFSAPVGKVYNQLIETKYGYHILKVEDRKPSQLLPLQEAAKTAIGVDETSNRPVYIKDMVMQQKAKARLDAKVAELKGKTTIKTYLPA